MKRRVVRFYVKRLILGLLWIILNIIGLIFGAVIVSNYLHSIFLIMWLFLVLVYGMAFPVITTLILNLLMGDIYDLHAKILNDEEA